MTNAEKREILVYLHYHAPSTLRPPIEYAMNGVLEYLSEVPEDDLPRPPNPDPPPLPAEPQVLSDDIAATKATDTLHPGNYDALASAYGQWLTSGPFGSQ